MPRRRSRWCLAFRVRFVSAPPSPYLILPFTRRHSQKLHLTPRIKRAKSRTLRKRQFAQITSWPETRNANFPVRKVIIPSRSLSLFLTHSLPARLSVCPSICRHHRIRVLEMQQTPDATARTENGRFGVQSGVTAIFCMFNLGVCTYAVKNYEESKCSA